MYNHRESETGLYPTDLELVRKNTLREPDYKMKYAKYKLKYLNKLNQINQINQINLEGGMIKLDAK